MSIISIKQLLGSDVLSDLVEKVNFNFDQILQAGGGPAGLQGVTGPSGGYGPQGVRGSIWFAGPGASGSTSAYDGGPLEEGDQAVDQFGDIWTFFDGTGGTGWTYSGVNVMGATGPVGGTGSSFEWQYYLGFTGGVQDAYTYGPTTGNVSNVNGPDVDFVVINQGGKNSVLLGDRNWAYEKLSDFSTYPVGTDQRSVPKITLFQNEVNYAGLNGLAFGAMGLTSSGTLPAIGSTADAVTAYDFVYAGFAREAGLVESHRFRLTSFRMPMKIRVGGDDPFYRSADFELESRDFYQRNYNESRGIYSRQGFLDGGATHSYVGMHSAPDGFSYSPVGGTVGYVALQSEPGSITSVPGWICKNRSASSTVSVRRTSATTIFMPGFCVWRLRCGETGWGGRTRCWSRR